MQHCAPCGKGAVRPYKFPLKIPQFTVLLLLTLTSSGYRHNANYQRLCWFTSCAASYTLYILYWVLQINDVSIKKRSPFKSWRVGGGGAPILHNKPISFFSVFFFLFFPNIQFSTGRLHCSHNANHSWSLFMHWLICKDGPSSSNSQQRRNVTASRVILNLSVGAICTFFTPNEEALWNDANLRTINQNPLPYTVFRSQV